MLTDEFLPRLERVPSSSLIETTWDNPTGEIRTILETIRDRYGYRAVVTFRLAELPANWRNRAIRSGRTDWPVARHELAVSSLRCMGVDLPLKPETPWGIVGDYITDNMPPTASNRLLARMCWKVQDGMDAHHANENQS